MIIIIKNSKRIDEMEFDHDHTIVKLYAHQNYVYIATSDRTLKIYDCSPGRGSSGRGSASRG